MFGTTHHELSAQLLIQMDAEHSDCGFLGGGGVISLHYGFHSTIQYKGNSTHTFRFQHQWAPVQLYLPPGQSRTPNVPIYLAQILGNKTQQAGAKVSTVTRGQLGMMAQWAQCKVCFLNQKFRFLNLRIPVLYRLGTHHSSEFKPNTPGRPLVRVI